MKCLNCNAEWNVPRNISQSLSNCPFCGKSICPPTKTVLHIEDALTEMVRRFGLDVLKNGQRTIAIFSDLFPNMERDRRLLSYLIQSKGNEKLISARSSALDSQQACLQQVYQYMVDEQFVAEEAAAHICTGFSIAIGLTVTLKKTEKTELLLQRSDGLPSQKDSQSTEPTPKAVPIKSQPMQQRISTQKSTQNFSNTPRISTHSEYRKALEKYYLQTGQKHLTDSQIRTFIASNALDRAWWGISVSDVQKDLQKIYAKFSSSSTSVPQSATTSSRRPIVTQIRSQIHTYDQYMVELEHLYLTNGRTRLSKDQIVSFIQAFQLEKKFGIQVSEVQTDLEAIYKKYAPTKVPAIRPSTPVCHQTPSTPTNVQIRTYGEYMAKLEQDYLANGKSKLTRVRVVQFIQKYQLDKNFGVQVSEVQKDLEDIYAKYTPKGTTPVQSSAPAHQQVTIPPANVLIRTYTEYMAKLNQEYLANGKSKLTRAQVVQFIQKYQLDKNFGILTSEVEKDLEEIYGKNTIPHPLTESTSSEVLSTTSTPAAPSEPSWKDRLLGIFKINRS